MLRGFSPHCNIESAALGDCLFEDFSLEYALLCFRRMADAVSKESGDGHKLASATKVDTVLSAPENPACTALSNSMTQ